MAHLRTLPAAELEGPGSGNPQNRYESYPPARAV